MVEEIELFFEHYSSAAEAMDADALGRLHHAPCLKVHGDGRIECLATPDAVRGFFQKLAGKYEVRDHSGGRYVDLEVTQLAQLPHLRH